ncbi:phenylacetate--CoA ligase family protein, partial [bacterium]|nr:phenylacetate--CoA ligase family protein [bacterium]
MNADQQYWNPEFEPLLNTTRMREIQLEKLKKLVHRVYNRNNYWKRRMDKAGVKPGDIKSLDDFSHRIPVFDKAQRRELSEQYNGDVIKVIEQTIATDMNKLCLMAATSGTTGEPTPYPITQ